ncbi:MAG: hypothetical protein ACYTEQ_14995 [Planctomycetota bacterium]|jgi:hypothetical protein
MGSFIKKLDRFVSRLRNLHQVEACVVVSNDGFCLKFRTWPLPARTRAELRWDEVREIHGVLRDCFTAHLTGLRFTDSEGKYTLVYDDSGGWDAFFKEVLERFPKFNVNNYEAVIGCLPGEACFPCWHFQKEIDNLVLDAKHEVIYWEKDGSVFYRAEGGGGEGASTS